MGFGNFGIWEMLLIAMLILIFFGPRRLPEITRSLGKAMREFKRGVNEIQRELDVADFDRPRSASRPASPAPTAESSAETETAAGSSAGTEAAAEPILEPPGMPSVPISRTEPDPADVFGAEPIPEAVPAKPKTPPAEGSPSSRESARPATPDAEVSEGGEEAAESEHSEDQSDLFDPGS